VRKLNPSLGSLGYDTIEQVCAAMPMEVRSRMTKMHLPPRHIEVPPEGHSWGFALVVLVFAASVAVGVYFLL